MNDLNNQLDDLISTLEAIPNKSLAVKDSLHELDIIKSLCRMHPHKMNDANIQDLVKDAMEDAIEAGALGIFLKCFDK